MKNTRVGRRELLGVGSAALAVTAAGLLFRPSAKKHAAYPFATRLSGEQDPLWLVDPDELTRATADDARRLEQLLPRLDASVQALETLDARLATGRVGELSAEDREHLRQLWWQVFEPILAIDELKSRYQGWYGLDYVRFEQLHARAFALSFTALCGQVDAGLRLLAALQGKELLGTLFDEAMPQFGLPARTFSGLRAQLGRASDLLLIPLGNQWYERWIEPPLAQDSAFTPLASRLEPWRRRALSRVLTPTTSGLENQLAVVKSALFVRWFPIQKNFAEWAGDTRVAKQDRHLISDEQLAAFKAALQPGDIIVERRNWYLSNIGLPGFWPHAAIFVGSQAQISSSLQEIPEVRRALGDLAERFRARYPKAWASLAERDPSGHERCVIEAVSEGVGSASLEHSCAADYVAAVRPTLPALVRARAIERALAYWGRPYDFNFDFATDDQVVCSELVVKAYESSEGMPGLTVPYVELLGRRAVPPTELVRAFRDQRGKPNPELSFVYYLEGREGEHRAVVSDADALCQTCDRPKWDIVQP